MTDLREVQKQIEDFLEWRKSYVIKYTGITEYQYREEFELEPLLDRLIIAAIGQQLDEVKAKVDEALAAEGQPGSN